ncbi:ATP synthase subunit s, mitochondrial [Armadillidium vulgare]|nr:ATP synthase subunit s, mitochondrial [Armadillidium vulgare]
MLRHKLYPHIFNSILKHSRITIVSKLPKYSFPDVSKSHYSILTSNVPFTTKIFLHQFYNEGKNYRFHIHERGIWGVDDSRILDAGPDRACAEWLLRCGAGVKWVNSDAFLKDYNSLPLSGTKLYKIEEVDATDSSIMFIGFPYFRNCKYIRKLVLHRAGYIDDESLSQLHFLKKSLKELQVSSCGNVSRQGLNHLKVLKNLEHLLLYDLPQIVNKEEVIQDLQSALPECEISFPYAQASEISDNEIKET